MDQLLVIDVNIWTDYSEYHMFPLFQVK